ncbi:hypothetical protein LguiA_022819 [Lonicera macranthoides]
MINSDISSQEDLVDVLLNLEQSADLDLPITANNVKAIILIGRHYIVDAISVEESQMSSALYVSINRHRRICRMTKHASEQFIMWLNIILDMIYVYKVNFA